MTKEVLDKVDRNKTVEQLMGEVARTGNRYIDLETGEFINRDPRTASATPPNLEEEKKSREELENLSMKELRNIGEPLGASDTKKSELIDEILEKQ